MTLIGATRCVCSSRASGTSSSPASNEKNGTAASACSGCDSELSTATPTPMSASSRAGTLGMRVASWLTACESIAADASRLRGHRAACRRGVQRRIPRERPVRSPRRCGWRGRRPRCGWPRHGSYCGREGSRRAPSSSHADGTHRGLVPSGATVSNRRKVPGGLPRDRCGRPHPRVGEQAAEPARPDGQGAVALSRRLVGSGTFGTRWASARRPAGAARGDGRGRHRRHGAYPTAGLSIGLVSRGRVRHGARPRPTTTGCTSSARPIPPA